jgi:hypothetical protein
LVLVWGVLSLAALFGIEKGYPPRGSFVATRELKFGHRIVAGDVETVPLFSLRRTLRPQLGRLTTSGDFVGRYVIQTATIPKLGSIELDATADHPVFGDASTGHTLTWVQLPDVKAAVAGDIDPGDQLDVCGDADNCARTLTVAAIACGTDGACSAATWVTDAERDKLVRARAKPLSVFVHPKGAKP